MVGHNQFIMGGDAYDIEVTLITCLTIFLRIEHCRQYCFLKEYRVEEHTKSSSLADLYIDATRGSILYIM